MSTIRNKISDYTYKKNPLSNCDFFATEVSESKNDDLISGEVLNHHKLLRSKKDVF